MTAVIPERSGSPCDAVPPSRDWGAALAQRLWLAHSAGAARRYEAALTRPAEAQAQWLRLQLAAHAGSEIGQALGFGGLHTPTEFARAVPFSTFADLAPWIARIRRGERDLLATGPVTHLVPTSGSTGARKLIPFTAGLQHAFDGAVGPWLTDLVRARPRLTHGPAYWSISPLEAEDEDGGRGAAAPARRPPPIGFADDAGYLGGAAAWLVRRVMAVPSVVRSVRDGDAFWALTALALLRHRGLRMLSVWHPSFIDLLVGAVRQQWDPLVDAVARGGAGAWADALPRDARRGWLAGPQPRRAAELRRAGPGRWDAWWPGLEVVSCWGEQAAANGHARLRAQLPRVLVQAKGLLATEGVVTIPYRGALLLAVTSHFFEFLDDAGDARLAHELERGATYEVVLTNGAGLWRYRLGDLVECTGLVGATPSLRFVGRAGRGADLRGEKLSEPFVAEVLQSLWPGSPPAYAGVRPFDDVESAGYELVVSADACEPSGAPALADGLDVRLRANPHYALARRLGQLRPPRVVIVGADYAMEELRSCPGRVGELKPRVLLPTRTQAAYVPVAGTSSAGGASGPGSPGRIDSGE